LHSNVVSFARLVSNVVLTAAGIGFFLIYLKNSQTTKMSTSSFKGIIPSKEKIDTKNLLMPNICYSSIYNMPLTLFLPFINDAYYYGNIKSEEGEREYKSSFEIEEYVKLFFDEDYEINVRGNLVNKADSVTMIQYNVKNKKNYLTILAIKGTSISTDMYIDAQLYVSSIFLSILSAFSLSTQKDTKTFKLIEYSLSIPYRIFFRFLIIDKYMKDLKDAYVENEYSFFNNVVIVGHSLGGGLAKLFGRFMGKQAISLSGPGINAFQSLWNYEKSGENFEISAIDLVPDMDLVPRVEVSGGTIYRIICKIGVFKCHEKEISLCETLIMCRNPIYESLCLKQTVLKDNDIKKIEEGSELN
jgi:lipase ATG15